MGVHSLGRAQSKFSGYQGWWSDAANSRRFNNNYYISMVAKGWIPEKSLPDVHGVPQVDKNQWKRGDEGAETATERHEMMLNTDLCLFFSHTDRLNAREHDCCAWKFTTNPSTAPGSNMSHVIANNGNTMCGAQCNEEHCTGGFQNLKATCCGSHELGTDCGFFPGTRDPRGDAIAHVMEFAEKEELWVEAFLDAWRKATTNGMQDQLRPLGFVNDAGIEVCS